MAYGDKRRERAAAFSPEALRDYEQYRVILFRRSQSALSARGLAAKRRRPKPVVPMTDDAGRPRPSKAPPKRRNAKVEILHGPLKAWMERFALWMAQQPEEPSLHVQCEKASFLSKMKVKPGHVKWLKARLDWRNVYEEYQQDLLSRAKAEYYELLPRVVEAQRLALEEAIEKKQFGKVSKILEMGMDRLLPKKQDQAVTAREVHIHLASTQQADRLLAAVSDEIVVEPSEVEVVEPDAKEV